MPAEFKIAFPTDHMRTPTIFLNHDTTLRTRLLKEKVMDLGQTRYINPTSSEYVLPSPLAPGHVHFFSPLVLAAGTGNWLGTGRKVYESDITTFHVWTFSDILLMNNKELKHGFSHTSQVACTFLIPLILMEYNHHFPDLLSCVYFLAAAIGALDLHGLI